jgi:predicted membrane protein
MERRASVTPGLVFGIVILALGVILLLDRQGIIQAGDIFPFFWPAVFLAAGLFKLVQSSCASGRVWGGILTAAGILLLLDRLGYVRVSFHALWPLILIGIGLMLVWRTLEGRSGRGLPFKPVGVVNAFAAFGGGDLKSDTKDFQGGDVFAVFGGYNIDLRNASMQAAEAVLDANAVFGGVEIRVPLSWSVSIHGLPLLGGYTDETVHPKSEDGGEAKRLIVRGLSMFGGVVVKN